MTTAAAPAKKKKREKKVYPLVNGHPIHFRTGQQLIWTVIAAVLGVGFVAGVYWLGLQQHYPFRPGSGSAKLWWDNGMNGLIRSPRWAAYRHGIRDNGEPEFWAMIGATLLGKVKANPRLLPMWLVPFAGLLVLAGIVAGAVGITWVVTYGPGQGHNPANLLAIALAFVVGRILHIVWGPFAATIRYHIISRSARGSTRTPMWVSLPLMPPAWREGWSVMRANRPVTAASTAAFRKDHRQALVIVPMLILAFLFVALVGNLAKYGIGAHGMTFPGMTTG